MNPRSALGTLAALFAFATAASMAQTPAVSGQDHAAHHPASAASAPKKPAAAAKPAASRPKAAPVSQAMGEGQMMAMHAMHEKMMSAKSPAERQALLGEHMKMMKDGMAMMGGTRDMQMRMDMMESMMQMMVDRMDAMQQSR